MDPRFECPFCGKERHHETSPKSVNIKGNIYFKDVDFFLNLNHTFCNIDCLLRYINKWHADAEDIARRWDEEMDRLEAEYA